MNAQATELANGFRVASDRMEGWESAEVGVYVLAGGRFEDKAETGISHFLEHMAFKGTARRSAFDIAAEIESVGGSINAYTSREVTAYHARVLAEDLPGAVDILADILRAPRLAAEDIELERGVILQEIKQYLDDPDEVVDDRLAECVWPDQPLGRTILGPAENVGGFRAEHLRAYMARHYRPRSMILAAAGAVDHAALVEQAQALFGDLPGNGAATRAEAARYGGGESRETKPLEQAHLAFALPAPGYRDPERYAARAFAQVLGGGMTSRLFQEAREKRGLCYGIGAGYTGFRDTGLLEIQAGTGAESVAELSRIVVDETRRLADSVTADEVARVRAQMRAAELMGNESPATRSMRLAGALAVWGRLLSVEEVLEQIAAISTARVRSVGARMMEAGPLAAVFYGPVGNAPDAAALRHRLTG